MVRTTVMLTKAQHIALAELAKTDPAGLKPAHLIRPASSPKGLHARNRPRSSATNFE